MMFLTGFVGASFMWILAWIVAVYYLDLRFAYLSKMRHNNIRLLRKDFRQIITLGGRLVSPGPSTSAIDRAGVLGMVILMFLIGYAILVNKYWDTLFNGI